MLQRLSTSELGTRPDRLSRLFEQFGRWWLHEFLSLFPERTAEWLTQRGRNALVIRPECERVSLQLLDSTQRARGAPHVCDAEEVASAIDRCLKSHGVKRKSIDIGIRFPRESFFERLVTLPTEAARSLTD